MRKQFRGTLFLASVTVFTAALFGMTGCAKAPPAPSAAVVPAGMALVWSDEFETDGAPDPKKWDYSTGGNGWGNGEVQNYTNKRDNSVVRNGNLILTAVNNGGMWTSARLKTQYLAQWTFGYVEIRAKLPKGVGTWPALWMLPVGDTYGGWPRSGEIDIAEHVGFDQNRIHSTVHTGAYNHKINTQKNFNALIKDASSDYHVYAVDWNPEYIEWYVDGKSFFRFDNEHKTVAEWPFDIPYYLIMNVAIGGSWGGQKGIDKKLKSASMTIDYVRVYQKI